MDLTRCEVTEADRAAPAELGWLSGAPKEAEKVTIELPVYEIGPTQMTFPVAGLEWE